MAKKLLVASLLLLIASAAFADQAKENQIASACKPYLQQYQENTNPNNLPSTAQQALQACQAHNSCTNYILSNPTNGIPNCAVKLFNLQPTQNSLIIVTPQTEQMAAPQPTAKPLWQFGSTPPAQNTATQPTNTNTDTNANANTSSSSPENTNQPLNIVSPSDTPPKKPPSINWF